MADIRGSRFNPTDKELMASLLCFVTDHKPIPFQDHIKIVNVYGDQEPWEIMTSQSTVFYCFTHLKRRIKKNKQDSLRFDRRVGRSVGTWKGQNKGVGMFDNRGRLIGHKKSMRYENKQSRHHGEWLMKEYCLAENLSDKVKHKDFVLCRIKRKGDQEVDRRHDQGQNRLCDQKMDEITALSMANTESSHHGCSVVKNSSERIKEQGRDQVNIQSHLCAARDNNSCLDNSEVAPELEQEPEKSFLDDVSDKMEESDTEFALELEHELELQSCLNDDHDDKMEISDTEFVLELERELALQSCLNDDHDDKMEISDTEFALELEHELELQSCVDDGVDEMDNHESAIEVEQDLEQSAEEANEEMSMEPNNAEKMELSLPLEGICCLQAPWAAVNDKPESWNFYESPIFNTGECDLDVVIDDGFITAFDGVNYSMSLDDMCKCLLGV